MDYCPRVGDDFAARRVGSTLREKYRLDALIGVGGMAVVYRGVHRNGNRVAVKLLHPELSMHADLRARFLKEGYVANAVEHPGAVRVLDDDVTDDGAVFLVMELLEGESLGSVRERPERRLPPREVADLACQVLEVLVAAHAKGIVHRDIKPENLFLTRERVVKVLDFGIARMRESTGAASVTRTGRMMGTPAFMPREQALGLTNEIDGRTDLWALGATMFTLVSGEYVHEAVTPESMVVFAATRPARPVASVAPGIPPPIAAVIDRALAFAKEDRFPDARAMLTALKAAYRSSLPSVHPASDLGLDAHPATANAETMASQPFQMASQPFQMAPMAPRGRMVQSAPPDLEEPVAIASLLAGISTTSGVASEQRPRMAAPSMAPSMPPGGPLLAHVEPAPQRLGIGALLLAMLGGMLAMGIVAALGLAYAHRREAAQGGSTHAPPAASSVEATSSVSSPTSPTVAPAMPSTTTEAASSASSAAASRPPAPAPAPVLAPVQAKRREALPVVPASPPAVDCNPPVYFDPVTGMKKVKPGC